MVTCYTLAGIAHCFEVRWNALAKSSKSGVRVGSSPTSTLFFNLQLKDTHGISTAAD